MILDYRRLLHWIFPPSTDEQLLLAHNRATYRALYNPRIYQHVTALLPYTDQRVRAAIHLNKFHYHTYAQSVLAAVLEQHLTSLPTHAVVIPIPLSRKRMRTRGYNQTHEIIKKISKNMRQAYHPELLIRTRDTLPQTEVSKAVRLKNVQDAFIVPAKHTSYITNTDIILIDDVVTTGATLRAAKAALLPHAPTSVTCLALAH